MKQNSYIIVGAGFSGLTLAYYVKQIQPNAQVTIYDNSSSAGGLISTLQIKQGQVETAASGLLLTNAVESLCLDLKIQISKPTGFAKKRFIFFNDKARKWPFSFVQTLQIGLKFLFNYFARKPKETETIRAWGERLFGKAFVDQMLAPALQGIYAGDVSQMSADLVLGKFFKKEKREKFRGTVSFEGGMGELIVALKKHLQENGVEFKLNEKFCLSNFKFELKNNNSKLELENQNSQINLKQIIATNAYDASLILKSLSHSCDTFSQVSDLLNQIEMLPLITATGFWNEVAPIQGFGCLFPREKGIRSLGVLFNADLWSNRSELRSETWIMGGATDRYLCAIQEDGTFTISDQEIEKLIQKDREKLYGKESTAPVRLVITRWPKALPHYTLKLKEILKHLPLEALKKQNIFLHGNYLGQIGLSRILDQSKELAKVITSEEVH